jgi:hypothetical protein
MEWLSERKIRIATHLWKTHIVYDFALFVRPSLSCSRSIMTSNSQYLKA